MEIVLNSIDDDKKGMFYCVYYDNSRYWGRLLKVFAEDADSVADEVEIDFLQYVGNQYWDFPKRKNKEIIKAKFLFFGPCVPSETSKKGYKFDKDEEAKSFYKNLKNLR